MHCPLSLEQAQPIPSPSQTIPPPFYPVPLPPAPFYETTGLRLFLPPSFLSSTFPPYPQHSEICRTVLILNKK